MKQEINEILERYQFLNLERIKNLEKEIKELKEERGFYC